MGGLSVYRIFVGGCDCLEQFLWVVMGGCD